MNQQVHGKQFSPVGVLLCVRSSHLARCMHELTLLVLPLNIVKAIASPSNRLTAGSQRSVCEEAPDPECTLPPSPAYPSGPALRVRVMCFWVLESSSRCPGLPTAREWLRGGRSRPPPMSNLVGLRCHGVPSPLPATGYMLSISSGSGGGLPAARPLVMPTGSWLDGLRNRVIYGSSSRWM